jgi:hypothetical protein
LTDTWVLNQRIHLTVFAKGRPSPLRELAVGRRVFKIEHLTSHWSLDIARAIDEAVP